MSDNPEKRNAGEKKKSVENLEEKSNEPGQQPPMRKQDPRKPVEVDSGEEERPTGEPQQE